MPCKASCLKGTVFIQCAMVVGIQCALFSPGMKVNAADTEPVAARVEQLEEAAFSREKQARVVENQGLVPFWDRLNAASSTERFDVLARVGLESLTLGRETSRETYDHGVEEIRFSAGGQQLDAVGWSERIQRLRSQGYEITHSDWHQERFEIDPEGRPISDTRFTIQGRRNEGHDRMEVKATARVTWRKIGDRFVPARVEVIDGRIRRRSAEPSFTRHLRINLASATAPRQYYKNFDDGGFCIYDLNGDQLPEILITSHDKILWNRGHMKFEQGRLLAGDGGSTRPRVALVADVNGDGVPDWICDNGENLEVHAGLKEPSLAGAFEMQASLILLDAYPLKATTAITAGDIDRDGDLDLFVAQYRQPYESMPQKYWDANDGYGNTLLINDGNAHFTDGTEAAGLDSKRFRRTYAASCVDLDTDGSLDLVVVSDFYGTDVYRGDGEGRFTDVTADFLDSPHTFGMSHTIADYNRDGRLDMFVTGMSSTTSRRLERMRAFPEGFEEANRMRKVMGYGNRMYLARAGGGMAEPKFRDSVARTGWSWGSSSLDFDNDGDQDIYVGNGHITGKTTSDYCSSFWCRDIYVLPDVGLGQLHSYLNNIPNRQSMSWDGFQVKSLLVNQDGKGFQDLSYMFDVGFDYDCRQVVSTDLDLDGRVDLILSRQPELGTTPSNQDRPTSILLYRNVLDAAAQRDWIGFTLTGNDSVSPLGATLELDTTKGVRRATVISGDSYLCQHPAQKHFGIAPGTTVNGVTIIWPDGSKTVKHDLATRQYHLLAPPGAPGP